MFLDISDRLAHLKCSECGHFVFPFQTHRSLPLPIILNHNIWSMQWLYSAHEMVIFILSTSMHRPTNRNAAIQTNSFWLYGFFSPVSFVWRSTLFHFNVKRDDKEAIKCSLSLPESRAGRDGALYSGEATSTIARKYTSLNKAKTHSEQ